MRNLEIYRKYFETAYPEYAYRNYEDLRLLVSSIPDQSSVEEALESESARIIGQLLQPLILIKNYKTQIPFPLNMYEAVVLIAKVKNSEPSEELSSAHESTTKKLLEIQGFQLPTVSAVLHFCHPNHYPIVDRNIEASCESLADEYPEQGLNDHLKLPAASTSVGNKVKKYRAFIANLNLIKNIHNQAHETDYTFRELDKALMVFGVKSLRERAENANKKL